MLEHIFFVNVTSDFFLPFYPSFTSFWLLSRIFISNGLRGPQYCRAQQLESTLQQKSIILIFRTKF